MVSGREPIKSHKRVGKKLVPPLLQIGPWNEVSWVDELLPELFWIGLLNAQHGVAAGAAVCAELAKAGEIELKELDQKAFLCRMSSFELFDSEQLERIRGRLRDAGVLSELEVAISPLCIAYPECPLASFALETDNLESATLRVRRVLPSLFDRWDEPATFVQVHAVYMTFVQGRLFVSRDTSFANFPAVEAYPDTEESRAIAAGCRALVNTFGNNELNDVENWWAAYFWNRGLKLEECQRIQPL